MRWLLPLILFILLGVGWIFLTPSSAPVLITNDPELEESPATAAISDQFATSLQAQNSENIPPPTRTKIERPDLVAVDAGPWVTAQLLAPDGSPAKGAFAWLAMRNHDRLMNSAGWTIQSGALDYLVFEADDQGVVRVPLNEQEPHWLKAGGEHWTRNEVELFNWDKEEDFDLGPITLFPAFSIRGKLTDFNQNPLLKQMILLENPASDNPLNWTAPLDISISNANGEFHFFGLTPGEYNVKAAPQGWVTTTQNVKLLNQNLNLFLEVDAGLTIQGQVVDHLGSPIPSARVRLDDLSLYFQLSIPGVNEGEGIGVNQDGYFTCSGMPEKGTKTLQVSAPGYLDFRPQIVSANTFIKVELLPVCQLEGRITDWTQQPITKAKVLYSTKGPLGHFSTTSAITDKDGKFLFKELSPGEAKLSLSSQFGALSLNIQIEQNGKFLEIELPKVQGWTLLAQDPDGKPIAGAYIRVEDSLRQLEHQSLQSFPYEFSKRADIRRGTTDENGKWMVYGLQNKVHSLSVSKKGWVKLHQEFTPPGTETVLPVVLEKAAVLKVTLLNADGSPATYKSLCFSSEAQPEFAEIYVEKTGKNGQATFDQLMGGPGELRLFGIEREANEKERWPLQIKAGETSAIECQLPTECTLRVLVLDGGIPVPRANIDLRAFNEKERSISMDETIDLYRELSLSGRQGDGRTGPDGIALIGKLDAIEYEVSVRPPIAAPPHKQRVFVVEGETLLTVELNHGRLEGKVWGLGGPIPNAKVGLHPVLVEKEGSSPGSIHTLTFSMDGEIYDYAPSGAYVKTNQTGFFAFHHLQEGQWRVHVKASQHLDWKSKTISLPARGFQNLGVITLEASGSLKGQILNLPAETTFTSMASLSLQPTKEGEYAYLHSTFDTAGNYFFSTVPAGEYTLTISFQVEVESLRMFETEPIQILQGQETVFDWKMPN